MLTRRGLALPASLGSCPPGSPTCGGGASGGWCTCRSWGAAGRYMGLWETGPLCRCPRVPQRARGTEEEWKKVMKRTRSQKMRRWREEESILALVEQDAGPPLTCPQLCRHQRGRGGGGQRNDCFGPHGGGTGQRLRDGKCQDKEVREVGGDTGFSTRITATLGHPGHPVERDT